MKYFRKKDWLLNNHGDKKSTEDAHPQLELQNRLPVHEDKQKVLIYLQKKKTVLVLLNW